MPVKKAIQIKLGAILLQQELFLKNASHTLRSIERLSHAQHDAPILEFGKNTK